MLKRNVSFNESNGSHLSNRRAVAALPCTYRVEKDCLYLRTDTPCGSLAVAIRPRASLRARYLWKTLRTTSYNLYVATSHPFKRVIVVCPAFTLVAINTMDSDWLVNHALNEATTHLSKTHHQVRMDPLRLYHTLCRRLNAVPFSRKSEKVLEKKPSR